MNETIVINGLLQFARANNLSFEYRFDTKIKVHCFTFYNQERTWGYRREITDELIYSCNVSCEYIAWEIINTLKEKLSVLINEKEGNCG